MKFFVFFYLSLLCCPSLQATFKEIICNISACPRFAACLCVIKKDPKCSVKIGCENLFVTHERSRTDLFMKKVFFKAEYVGGIRYPYISGDSGSIANIFLNEEWRGKGLGYILMQRALNEMDHARVPQVTLAVGDWNKSAISLYKKCGFLNHKKLDGGYIMLRTLPTKN